MNTDTTRTIPKPNGIITRTAAELVEEQGLTDFADQITKENHNKVLQDRRAIDEVLGMPDGYYRIHHAMGYLLAKGEEIYGSLAEAEQQIKKRCKWKDAWLKYKKAREEEIGSPCIWILSSATYAYRCKRQAATRESWRGSFRRRSELDSSPMSYVIERLIPEEGVTGIGGLSGHSKTWLMMSMAKTICRGGFLWGQFEVKKQRPVLYLTPEVGDRSFYHRMKLLDIPDTEKFLVRTMTQGVTSLGNPDVLDAAKGRVVFLDTLVRFTEGKDEQQARDMSVLGDNLFWLLKVGAVAVVFAHHSPKNARHEDEMTLENAFRGSGDIGAIVSAAHGVRMIDNDRTLVQVECVKARDFKPLKPFQLEGRPWITREHDFRMVKKPGECSSLADARHERANDALAGKILEVIQKHPGMSGSKIVKTLGANRNRAFAVLHHGIEKELWKEGDGEKATGYFVCE